MESCPFGSSTSNLPLSHYESVLNDVLHSIRSLLCVATNLTQHERFFNFQRRSCTGQSLLTRLTSNNKAFFRRFIRHSKSDPYVDEVERVNVNPTYAEVRYLNGREATVSIRHPSPCPNEVVDFCDKSSESDITENNSNVVVDSGENINKTPSETNSKENNIISLEQNVRRSNRCNKGVPPARYGVNY